MAAADVAIDPIPAAFRALGRAARRSSAILRLHGRRHRSAILGASADAETLRDKAQTGDRFPGARPATGSSAASSSPSRPTISMSASWRSMPALQGLGVGRRLLEAAEQHALRCRQAADRVADPRRADRQPARLSRARLSSRPDARRIKAMTGRHRSQCARGSLEPRAHAPKSRRSPPAATARARRWRCASSPKARGCSARRG